MKHINTKVLKKLTPLAILFLTGCSGMESKFDCNVSSGGRCSPMHQINRMASRGYFNDKHRSTIPSYVYDQKTAKSYPLNPGGIPLRSNERIQQIWIGPYEDASGNYHDQTQVYTVVQKGKWIVN